MPIKAVPTRTSRNQFWNRWLFIVSVLLAVQGASWVVMGTFDPFGFYDSLAAPVLLGTEDFSPEARTTFRYAVALLGATDAAFFVLFAFIAKIPFAAGERWAHVALTAGILTWFTIDSAYSLWAGAVFNLVIVNIPCLLLIGIPLVATARKFYAAA